MHAATYSAPAGMRFAVRRPGAVSILPGGRVLAPTGIQQVTGDGPYGLAISPNGKVAVTANGGSHRRSLSILRRTSEKWITKHVTALDGEPDAEEQEDVTPRTAFIGLAFEGNGSVYVSDGDSGSIRKVEIPDGDGSLLVDLNQGGFTGSRTGDLAIDAGRNLLYVLDEANSRLAVVDSKKKQVLSSVPLGGVPFALTLSLDKRKIYVTISGTTARRGSSESQGTAEGTDPVNAKGARADSLAIVDVSDPAAAKVETSIPFEPAAGAAGGPCAVLATADRVFVSHANQDRISVIDIRTHTLSGEIPLGIPGLENLRGILPLGMAYHEASGWLLVAEAGINAVGVIDIKKQAVIAHLPVGWFPTRIAIHEDNIYVANAKGNGVGPNAARDFAEASAGMLRRGTVSVFPVPGSDELPRHSGVTLQANGFLPSPQPAAPLPEPLRYVVLIVKEDRTFDETFGDITKASNGAVNAVPALARFGSRGYVDGKVQRFSLQDVNVTPNHHELADRYAFSDNFYADPTVTVTGRHRLVGAHADDATLWHHLARHQIAFRNFGQGPEGGAGGSMQANELLKRNTSPSYPGFDMSVPDQDRASHFINEVKQRYVDASEPFPRFILIHLPNDRMAAPRPDHGYPYAESFIADNDLALGRILEFLSGTPWWREMAVFITQDEARGGRDHVDAHRTVLLAAGPYAKRNYVSHMNSSFPGLLKTIFRILRVPPMNLFDAAAADLADCFTTEPDFSGYRTVSEDPRLFVPEEARKPQPGDKEQKP